MARDREAQRRALRKWKASNPDKVKANNRLWWNKSDAAHKERRAGYRFKRKYGITLETAKNILRTQGDGCAICETSLGIPAKHSHVDHNHTTGVVRGILCAECNLGLGKFKDSVGTLLAAVKYLEDHND